MVGTEPYPKAVCDAGPLIHLDELDALDVLLDFSDVLVPEAVWSEVAAHRPRVTAALHPFLRPTAPVPPEPPGLDALARAFVLGAGELAALCAAVQRPGSLLLTDDGAARLVAEILGLPVHGSLGVLVRAMRVGRRTQAEVITLLESIPTRSSLHIRPSLLREVIDSVRSHP